jgi:hypothetical protein
MAAANRERSNRASAWMQAQKMAPPVKTWEFSTPESRYPVHALSLLLGDDLVICLWGGTEPHVGAVALAQPRPSIADHLVTSSTSSILTLLGHKEDVVAKLVAERVSADSNRNVVVAAGIHWDNIGEEAIEEIVQNCERLAERIAAALRRSG